LAIADCQLAQLVGTGDCRSGCQWQASIGTWQSPIGNGSPRTTEVTPHTLSSLREAALTVLREVDSLTSSQPSPPQKFGLREEVQRYEMELIKDAVSSFTQHTLASQIPLSKPSFR
jgi:hypothetical protein